MRLTDKDNGGPAGFEQGTLQDRNFDATVPCTSTPSTSIGSTCSLFTTADAITPGVVAESKRTMWQLGQVQLQDGGSDGVGIHHSELAVCHPGLLVP